jgi:hypothetical protein
VDDTVRDIQSYFEVRRETIGTRPSFAMLQLDMDIPDDIMENPILSELEVCTTDMILLGNVRVLLVPPCPLCSNSGLDIFRTYIHTTWNRLEVARDFNYYCRETD